MDSAGLKASEIMALEAPGSDGPKVLARATLSLVQTSYSPWSNQKLSSFELALAVSANR
jgi:hypothetical protein